MNKYYYLRLYKSWRGPIRKFVYAAIRTRFRREGFIHEIIFILVLIVLRTFYIQSHTLTTIVERTYSMFTPLQLVRIEGEKRIDKDLRHISHFVDTKIVPSIMFHDSVAISKLVFSCNCCEILHNGGLTIIQGIQSAAYDFV